MLENVEPVPGYKIKNTIIADLECICNLRGLSGNSGSFPFYDCKCSQKNRNKPKAEREPCQPRMIQDCVTLNKRWREETSADKAKVKEYENCLNVPLLQKSFRDDRFRLPIMHVTTGIPVHDINNLEDELLLCDQTDSVDLVKPNEEEGVFYDYIQYKSHSANQILMIKGS